VIPAATAADTGEWDDVRIEEFRKP